MLAGVPLGPCLLRRELFEGERFIPQASLDRETSILGSLTASVTAVRQFTLPKDDGFLKRMLSFGLHLALKAYLVRGLLLEQELYERLRHMHDSPQGWQTELVKERSAKEETEKKIDALEAELNGIEPRWCREVDVRDKVLKGLRSHNAKQAASIAKLQGEVAQLKVEVGRLQQGISERDDRLTTLVREVESERRLEVAGEEDAQASRLSVKVLNIGYRAFIGRSNFLSDSENRGYIGDK